MLNHCVADERIATQRCHFQIHKPVPKIFKQTIYLKNRTYKSIGSIFAVDVEESLKVMRSFGLYILCFCVFAMSCQSLDEKATAKKEELRTDNEKIKEASDFLTVVAKGVYKDVELSRLAVQKASLVKVREFAKNMMTDYDKNIDGLLELAQRKNIELTMAETPELTEQFNKLKALEGIEFDKEYIKMMVKDHEEDVEKFRSEVEKGRDIEVKAFAAGKLSIITHHLDMAKTLHDSMTKS